MRQFPAGSPRTERAAADAWRSVSLGVRFSGEHAVFISEGNSGRVALVDLDTEERRRAIDLNQNGYHDSFTGDLALDARRNVLYVADQANFRIAVIDTRSRQVLASVKVGRLPFAMTLSPDRRKLYVTNVGMFEYRALPAGFGFPAFGFPGAEAIQGVQTRSESGTVPVPGLGDPNAPESNSVCVIDVSEPAVPKTEAFVRTGQPFGKEIRSGSSPSGIVATAERVYVSNGANDSITVINARNNRVEGEIPIRIPNLVELRGVIPMGVAYHDATGWLLVAEAGINAIGVIDTRSGRVLGHIPAGWFPTRVLVEHDTVFVANLLGRGTGPNAIVTPNGIRVLSGELDRGSISIFPLPAGSALAAHTEFVMRACGFEPSPPKQQPIPNEIGHVVLIVKANRSFDELLGDITHAANGRVAAVPALARFGREGYADGRGKRLSLHDVNLTPNLHAMAERWSFSDNFYADSTEGAAGRHWLAGVYPMAWSSSSLLAGLSGGKDFRISAAPGRLAFPGAGAAVQPEDSPESGTIWRHLAEHKISFYNFGAGLDLAGATAGPAGSGATFLTNMPMPAELYTATSRSYPGFNLHIPDTGRAARFIQEIEEHFVRARAELPQLLYIYLPNDALSEPEPQSGFPYAESYAADNDLALGRIAEYLSKTKWWRNMVIFVTEDSARGGLDHIDTHRTLLICAGPWAKHGYVLHTNSSFPAISKTINEIFHLPAHNLFDASAASLSDCFRSTPDFEGYEHIAEDMRVYQEIKTAP